MNGFLGWRSVLWVVGLSVCLPCWAHPEIDTQIDDVSARIASEPSDALLLVRRGELHRVHRDDPARRAANAATVRAI